MLVSDDVWDRLVVVLDRILGAGLWCLGLAYGSVRCWLVVVLDRILDEFWDCLFYGT